MLKLVFKSLFVKKENLDEPESESKENYQIHLQPVS